MTTYATTRPNILEYRKRHSEFQKPNEFDDILGDISPGSPINHKVDLEKQSNRRKIC